MKKIYTIGLLMILALVQVQAQSDQVDAKKGKITIHPVLHASMVLEWNGKTIYVDPYGGAERYTKFPKPDLILITDIHGDHLNKKTLGALDIKNAELIAPQAVIDRLNKEDVTFAPKKFRALANGKTKKVMGIKVKAIPMYNLPENAKSRHPKGRGNGYLVTLGGKKLYISGDTEDIKEMRALKNIDIAFVCMNLPYTMNVNQAASAVIEFKPKIVYPFHFRGKEGFSDVKKFKSLVNKGDSKIEVRLRDWYGK
ncbi:MAG TPA: MBL fold metallo-hydrolase [Microscillaceae bacterium]|nr:MBL fold metallo-hydrolase [Microscillaceae bacterium]